MRGPDTWPLPTCLSRPSTYLSMGGPSVAAASMGSIRIVCRSSSVDVDHVMGVAPAAIVVPSRYLVMVGVVTDGAIAPA